jgi:hypothetical protein
MKAMTVEILGITHSVEYKRESKTVESAIQETLKKKIHVNYGFASVIRDGVKTLYWFTNCGRMIIRINE